MRTNLLSRFAFTGDLRRGPWAGAIASVSVALVVLSVQAPLALAASAKWVQCLDLPAGTQLGERESRFKSLSQRNWGFTTTGRFAKMIDGRYSNLKSQADRSNRHLESGGLVCVRFEAGVISHLQFLSNAVTLANTEQKERQILSDLHAVLMRNPSL
jgi:hypothetical protein